MYGTAKLPAVIVRIGEEPAQVSVEIRITGQRKSKSGRNLASQRMPGGLYVSAPYICTSPLLSRICRTGKNAHSSVGSIGTLIVIHTLDTQKRISIANTSERTVRGRKFEVGFLETQMIRLGRVHPPCIYTHFLKPEKIVPINIPGFLAEHVIRLHSGWIVHSRRP